MAIAERPGMPPFRSVMDIGTHDTAVLLPKSGPPERRAVIPLLDGARTPITVSVDTFPSQRIEGPPRLKDIPYPRAAEKYMTNSPEGQRLDVSRPEITATLEYVDKCLTDFKVEPGQNHANLKREHGLETSEDVRDFLLADKTGIHLNARKDIALPYAFIESNHGYFGGQLYYWDSADHIRMILAEPTPERIDLAKGTIENFKYLFDRLIQIPNGSNNKIENCSQPPLLTTMILDIYKALEITGEDQKENRDWLRDKMDFAKKEYWEVWNNENDCLPPEERDPDVMMHNHCVPGTILRTYGDTDAKYHTNAERESGEDMTPRFGDKAGNFLAVDLNAKLALYEKHFEDFAMQEGQLEEAAMWHKRREKRIDEMMNVMWDEESGWMYDYNYKTGQRSPVAALAGFFTVTADILPQEKKDRMVEKIPEFMQPYGLTLTTSEHPVDTEKGTQWAYPNDFANRKRQVVDALVSNGYYNEAIAIIERSIIAYAEYYDQNKTLPEKINAVTGERGEGAKYKDQVGFGWTNAAFLEFTTILPLLYEARTRSDDMIEGSRDIQEEHELYPAERVVYAH